MKYCCVKDKPDHQLGKWEEWSQWAECDQSCGGGIKRRRRQCPAGDGQCYSTMTKPDTEEALCNNIPCPVEPKSKSRSESVAQWSAWHAWTDCSKSCGPGKKWSYRNCKGAKGGCREEKKQKQWRMKDCTSEKCPGECQMPLLIYSNDVYNGIDHDLDFNISKLP